MPNEKDYFVENLAMLISSGMGIVEALDVIKTEIRSRKFQVIVENLKEELNGGSTLWAALDKAHIFSAQIISLIRLGEKSGRFSENLRAVASQQQKERNFQSKIRSAMMYPVLILSITIVIGVGIAWFILPKLSNVFFSLKIKLPLITKIFIALGVFLGQYGLIAVPLSLLAIVALAYFIFFYSKTSFIGQFILFRVPGVNRLIKEVEISRFGYIMGALLGVGLSITDTLDSLCDATNCRPYKKLYTHLRNNIIEEGHSFQESFSTYRKSKKLIPGPIQQMVAAGEQSGRLSETLLKVGESYEIKIEDTTKNLTVLLEPILLVIVWLGVVCVALAIILPLYSLIGGLNK